MSQIIVDSETRRAYAIKVIGLVSLEKPKRIIIEEYKETRSISANARLWALHTLAADKIGCSAAEVHEDMLAEHFGYTEVKMPTGIIRRIPMKRSSTRDSSEFAKFMSFCEDFYIRELGVWLEQNN